MSASADFDTVVLGAGTSGMVAASVLLNQHRKPLLLLDRYSSLGGNHIDVAIGPYTFDIGCFFFSADSPVFQHFPFLRRHYVPADPRFGRLTPKGSLASYPFSFRDDLVARGPVEWARAFGSLLRGRACLDPDAHALAYCEYWLGAHLTEETGLRYFLRRFLGTEPDQIEAEFARKRMGWVSRHARVGAFVQHWSRGRPTAGPLQLARPRSGFGPLYGLVGASLAGSGVEVRLATQILSIRRVSEGRYRVETEAGTFTARSIISTMPVTQVLGLCGLSPVPHLATRALRSLFYSHRGSRSFDFNVLYNFSRDGDWKRITVHSDFYGAVAGREFFTAEILVPETSEELGAEAERFEAHVRRCGLYDGDLCLEGTRITRSAYPLYLKGATEAAKAAVARLAEFGITSFGRQGGFDYQPTSVVSARVAEAALASSARDD